MTLSDELREAMERTRKEGMALGDGASTESPVARIEARVPAGVRLEARLCEMVGATGFEPNLRKIIS
jgi:hypothetical protein